jgi:mannuronan synthase
VLTLFRSPFRLTYPFLLYFSQVYGAILKTYVFFYPDRQRWTRQNTALVAGDQWLDRFRAFSSGYMRTLAGAFLLTLVATMMGLVNVSRI